MTDWLELLEMVVGVAEGCVRGVGRGLESRWKMCVNKWLGCTFYHLFTFLGVLVLGTVLA